MPPSFVMDHYVRVTDSLNADQQVLEAIKTFEEVIHTKGQGFELGSDALVTMSTDTLALHAYERGLDRDAKDIRDMVKFHVDLDTFRNTVSKECDRSNECQNIPGDAVIAIATLVFYMNRIPMLDYGPWFDVINACPEAQDIFNKARHIFSLYMAMERQTKINVHDDSWIDKYYGTQ